MLSIPGVPIPAGDAFSPFMGCVTGGRKNCQSSPRRHRLLQTLRLQDNSWLLPGFFHRASSGSWVRPEPVVTFGVATCPELAESFQHSVPREAGGTLLHSRQMCVLQVPVISLVSIKKGLRNLK